MTASQNHLYQAPVSTWFHTQTFPKLPTHQVEDSFILDPLKHPVVLFYIVGG